MATADKPDASMSCDFLFIRFPSLERGQNYVALTHRLVEYVCCRSGALASGKRRRPGFALYQNKHVR